MPGFHLRAACLKVATLDSQPKAEQTPNEEESRKCLIKALEKKQRVCGQLLPGQKPLTAYEFTQGVGWGAILFSWAIFLPIYLYLKVFQ